MLGSIVAAILGIALWTLAEYLLHRFLGHDKRTWPNAFAEEHIRHHSQGNYFAPSWKKGLAALGALAVITPLAVWIAGPATGGLFSVAFVGMYVTYEAVHRRCHTHAGLGSYGRFVRRHHFHHHFGNPKSNHGVTSPIWDYVFKTAEPSDHIRVPEKLAMVWLVDDQTGNVRPEFAAAYELVRKRQSNGHVTAPQ